MKHDIICLNVHVYKCGTEIGNQYMPWNMCVVYNALLLLRYRFSLDPCYAFTDASVEVILKAMG